jgi:HAD superfamily hydrolase (TIGR01509 family)
MSDIEALIFDVDGTLAETEEIHRLAFNAAFAAAGLDWSWDQALYRELLSVTGGKERMAHYVSTHDPRSIERVMPLIPGLHRDKTVRYAEMIAGGEIVLRPGIASLIEEAHGSGVKLAIATTTSADNVEALIKATLGAEALGWFAVIGAGDVVPAKKPAPDIYLWVLDRLGMGADQAVAFEDSRNGLLAAARAGLRTVVTPGLYTNGADFSEAAVLADDLGEIDGRPVRISDIALWLDRSANRRAMTPKSP